MGKGQGSRRRAATVKISVLVAVLLLTLLVPTLAFAYAGSFSGFTPAKASVVAPSPKISVIIYDRDGLGGASNFVMWLDGSRVPVAAYRYSAYGYKRYKLVYQASGLESGLHAVSVRVKDRTGAYDRTSWSFTVDGIAPVTTLTGSISPFISPFASPQMESGLLFLSATDAGGAGMGTTYFSLDGAATVAGSLVFYSFGPGNHTLDYWSVDRVGNIEGVHHVTQYVQSGHALPVNSQDSACIALGCHGGLGDVTAIHVNATFGTAPVGCPCHSSTLTPTNDCVACHSGTNAPANHATHISIDSSAAVGSGQHCTDAAPCHGNVVFTYTTPGIHATCATCHHPDVTTPDTPGGRAAAVIAAGVAGTLAHCEDCHGDFTSTHTGANPSHQVSGACFTSTCHKTDVTKMHTTDFRGTGATPVGCAACHNPRNDPSVTGTNCQACHFDIVSRHDAVAQHKSTVNGGINVAAQLAANSVGCVACHGSNIMGVMLLDPGTTDVPTSTTGADEHKGCTCHAYLIAGPVEGMLGGQASCTNCHKGAHAPHAEDFTAPNGGPVASGHNTTLFGEIGGLTKWDGSEGVVVKNSNEDTITQEWPLPTADVFWSQSNMTGPDAPLSAMDNRGFASAAAGAAAINTTVGWNSVITCGDCHTGLASVAGPQGANVSDFGIDANFPDDWTKAEFTTYDPTGMRSTETTVGSPNPYYVKTWVYGDTTPTTPGNGYSFGDVTGRFLCQKCHKLVNLKQGYPAQTRSGRSQQGMGVSNTAHMEHHPDQILGQANCVSCHVAIPHGWNRPRLLVYSTDPAPYKAPQPSNWFYTVANGYPATGTAYLDAIYGGVYTAPASWETSPPTPGFGKELVNGGTIAGWDNTVFGVEWIAPGTETGDNEGQPNCTACTATSKTTATHAAGNEGVPLGAPTWK